MKRKDILKKGVLAGIGAALFGNVFSGAKDLLAPVPAQATANVLCQRTCWKGTDIWKCLPDMSCWMFGEPPEIMKFLWLLVDCANPGVYCGKQEYFPVPHCCRFGQPI